VIGVKSARASPRSETTIRATHPEEERSDTPAQELALTANAAAVFGAELRRLRARAGLTQEGLAERIQYSESLVGAVERGEAYAQRGTHRVCERALGLDGELLRLWPLSTLATEPRRSMTWPRIEGGGQDPCASGI